MFRRPPRRARIHWRTWMPWYEFSRLVGEVQDHDEILHGGFTAAAILVAGTLAGAFVLPALALFFIVGGGLTTAGMLVCAHPDGARFVAELRAVGLPGPRTLLRLSAEMATADARAVWGGRTRTALADVEAPLLIEGPRVLERDEGTEDGRRGQ